MASAFGVDPIHLHAESAYLLEHPAREIDPNLALNHGRDKP
jgi:hypothetical protein